MKMALVIADTSWGAVSRWMADDQNVTEEGETFGVRYARARVHSAEGYASKAQSEVELADVEDWQVRKLRSDLYKWRAAMADPKNYGDKRSIEVSGGIEHLHLQALQAPRISINAKVLGAIASSDTSPDDTPKDGGE